MKDPRPIYLAVPYSHADPKVVEARVAVSNALAARYIGYGHCVFAPISHGHAIVQGRKNLPTDANSWKNLNEAILKTCKRIYVARLPGWDESQGIADEIAFATKNSIPVLFLSQFGTDKLYRDVQREQQKVFETSSDPKAVYNSHKPPLHLLPRVAMLAQARAHQNGAEKYGAWNWRQTRIAMTVYLSAMLRHTFAILDGELVDPDSGLQHLAHIAASCNILLDAEAQGTLIVDVNTPTPQ